MNIANGKLLTVGQSHALCDSGRQSVSRGTGKKRINEFAGMRSNSLRLRKKYSSCEHRGNVRLMTPREIAAFRARIDALIDGDEKPVRVFL